MQDLWRLSLGLLGPRDSAFAKLSFNDNRNIKHYTSLPYHVHCYASTVFSDTKHNPRD